MIIEYHNMFIKVAQADALSMTKYTLLKAIIGLQITHFIYTFRSILSLNKQR